MNSIVTRYTYVVDLLQDLVRNQSNNPTVLVICSTREDFLDQIISGLQARSDDPATTLHHDGDGDQEVPSRSASAPDPDFLSPVLSALNASRLIKLAFCPTISSLRAYFSSCGATSMAPTSFKTTDLIILNLVGQHHGSSEFTFQGLSQTLATVVSAGMRMHQAVQLVECKDVNDPSNANFGSTLWSAEVPLLSMSIKIGEDGARWGRRSVRVHKIASRWFRTEKSTDHNKASGAVTHRAEIPDSEDEMLI
ncbi:uncharacterized protein A1O9_08079 [Exophiala aquamarina CBS 119918]|uniref:Uncharacterized protein n=1 Tax=Exophiala aquamarina CBS 119918 TaxID=1182545 RepID=A0A072P5H6_9EURO|nr:uncharacterized protein A1O9_08079 [Exophiala aquamarina CBS 119918]KEF55329.1 hypothetical protein A1O9_08079 [Exophiala aquamarina CBS 119918]